LPQPPSLVPASYPRTYRPWSGGSSLSLWRVIFAFAVILVMWAGRGGTHWIALPALLVVGIASASQALTRFVLYPDRIERVSWIGKRQTVMRQDIVWRRSIAKDIFLSFTNDQQAWRLPGIRRDPLWDAWMAGIPDLDAQNQAIALANPKLGSTPTERSQRWKWGMWLAWFLVAATLLVGVWGPFQTEKYSVPATVALLALPWLALLYAWRWGDIMTADSQAEGETRSGNLRPGNPTLLVMATSFASGIGLFLVASQRGGLTLVEGGGLQAFGLGLAAFVAYTVAYFRATKYARIPMVALFSGFLVLPIVLAYSCAGVLCINSLSGASRSTYFNARVDGKYIYPDGSGNPTFHIGLAPWGPNKKETTFRAADADEYARYNPSDIVCVAMHSGLLGIRIWSTDGTCPPV